MFLILIKLEKLCFGPYEFFGMFLVFLKLKYIIFLA